jgi:hypothetical protein
MTWSTEVVTVLGPEAATLGDLAMVPLQSGPGEWSRLFAVVLAFAFVCGLAVLIILNRWNRADLDGEHAAYILTQLNGFGGTRGASVVVRSVDALTDGDVLADIRGLFHGGTPDETTVRSATAEIIREVRAELHSRKPPVSKVPARAIQEGVLTAILGALAIVPVAAWREATRSGGGAVPTVPELISAGQTVADIGLGAITAFPFTDVLFAFALTFGILGAKAAWTLWMVPPVVLISLGVAYFYLERRVETDRDLTGPPVMTWTRRFGVLAAITWLAGAVLATIAATLALAVPFIGRAILGLALAVGLIALYLRMFTDPVERRGDPFGPPETKGGGLGGEEPSRTSIPRSLASGARERFRRSVGRVRSGNWKWMTILGALGLGVIHELTAFLAASAVFWVVMVVWLTRTFTRWRRSAARDGRDAFALDVVHSLTVTAAALTVPLMVGYGIAAIGTGKALQVARVVLDAPSPTVLAVSVLAITVALAIAVMFLKRFRDIRTGFRRALDVQAVRAIMFARTFPLILTIIAAILLTALGVPVVGVVAVALAVGLIARFAFMVYNYATYRYRNRSGRDKSASRVVVNGRKVEDADGEPVYIAAVNGHRTAHRRVDPLVEQIRRDARSLLRDGKPEKGSFARYYYTEGVKRGKVDIETVADELLGDVRTRFRANVQQTDADAPDILKKLRSEYPEHVVDRVVQDLKDRGRVSRREDRFIWMG